MGYPNYDVEKRAELEALILGCLIVDKNSENILLNKHKIDSIDFFRDEFHREVFRICLWLHKRKIPIHLDTISIKRNDVYIDFEGPIPQLMHFDYNLIQLAQRVASASHIEHYILALKEYKIIDFWNEKSIEISENSWENRDTLVVSQNILEEYQMLEDKLTKGIRLDDGSVTSIRKKYTMVKNGELVFVPYPVQSINDYATGLMAPELMILAARPSMGKTTFAIILAIYASLRGFKVIIISLEMSAEQLINRIVANETGIELSKMRSLHFDNDAEFEKYIQSFEKHSDNPNLIILGEKEAGKINQIEKVIEKEQPHLVIVDYLQLVKNSERFGSREQEVANISRELKRFCLLYGLPIIALSQLSRRSENRTDSRPMLSDLRESGAIEQDADIVAFLHRPLYYELLKNPNFIHADYELGNTEIIFAKGRSIGLKKIEVWIDLKKFIMEDGFKVVSQVGQLVSNPVGVPPPPPK